MKNIRITNFDEETMQNSLKGSDTACIIYTSGTGGKTKRCNVKSWSYAN